MPIYADPNETYPVVLDEDKDKPNPPTFMVRPQPIRKQRELDRWHDELSKFAEVEGTTFAQIVDKQVDKLAELIVDWKNVQQTFSREAILDVLEPGAVRDLLFKIRNNEHLTVDEKKS